MGDALIWVGTSAVLAVLSAIVACSLVVLILFAVGVVRETRRLARARAAKRWTPADRAFLVGQGIRPW